MTPLVRESPVDSLPPIVLLVEDDRDTLEMYSTYLESEGLWVATASDPIQGRDHARELQPNLLVTDIGFAGQPTGAEFVHAMKHDPQTACIPVIVLTGRAIEDLPSETQHDADLVLVKPVLPDVLLIRARELIAAGAALRARSNAALERAASLAT